MSEASSSPESSPTPDPAGPPPPAPDPARAPGPILPPPPAASGQPGHLGWPPAGYPPPFAPAGLPPTRSGGNAAVIALAVGLAVVLLLGVCCVLGLSGFVLAAGEDRATASDPPHDERGYQGDRGEDHWTGPAIPVTPSTTPTRPAAGPVTVVYEVTGGGRADIVYFDADSTLVHVDGARLPWRIRFTADGQSRVQVEASRTYPETGPVTCRLAVTGTGQPTTDTATAPWRATCSAG